MSLFRKALPGLYDGVSQQSPTMRSGLQCEEQINGWPTIADGVGKRPPAYHLAKLSSSPYGACTFHHINRDTTERYIVVVTDGDLKVYDHFTGAAVTVAFPTGKGYLDCDDAASDFALVSVADYTFVVNRSKVCALENPASPPSVTSYRWLNRPALEDGTVAAGDVYQYDAVPTGSTLTGTVQAFEDLPTGATLGQIYKITGSPETGYSSYYVRYSATNTWEEYRDPGIARNRLDSRTLPHALVREADGTFTFAPFSFAERQVGDEKSNPAPTFVGRTISDVFFVQNRLGFLVEENVVLSAAGDFGNFWRNHIPTYVASDPVDVAVTGSSVSVLHHAVPYSDSVLVFSDQAQFMLTWGQEGLTPDSAALTPVTTYATNLKAKPVRLGRDVYFCSTSLSNTRVYEYYNRVNAASTEAADVTSHVPRYIPAGVIRLTGDPTNDAVYALTTAEQSRLYLYKFAWANAEEKAQAAWSYWQFAPGDKVLSTEMLDTYLYLVIERADGVYLERIPMQARAPSFGLDHTVYLDRLVSITGTYDAGTDKTTFALPYAPLQSAVRVVRGSGAAAEESLIDPTKYAFPTATSLTVEGDHSGHPCLIGQAYEFRYTFSPQFATTDSGAILTGRTILRSMTVYYTDSAYFAVEVKPYGDAVEVSDTLEFTGMALGTEQIVLGVPSYATGSYTFQVYGEADTARVSLVNNTHVASTFQSAEIEITYHNRAR